jgi:hypothetical protein
VIPSVRVELELWRGGERPLGRALSQKAVVGISATSGSGGRSQSPKGARQRPRYRTIAFARRATRGRRVLWRPSTRPPRPAPTIPFARRSARRRRAPWRRTSRPACAVATAASGGRARSAAFLPDEAHRGEIVAIGVVLARRKVKAQGVGDRWLAELERGRTGSGVLICMSAVRACWAWGCLLACRAIAALCSLAGEDVAEGLRASYLTVAGLPDRRHRSHPVAPLVWRLALPGGGVRHASSRLATSSWTCARAVWRSTPDMSSSS